VVAILGDGGFMFAASELSTAAQHGIGVVAIVFNNGSSQVRTLHDTGG
jgi:acetolactate synthase-1/2/3 large subunit